MFFLCDLHVLARKLASPFGHPTQVPTQVQLVSTCDYLQVRLSNALEWRPLRLKKIQATQTKQDLDSSKGLFSKFPMSTLSLSFLYGSFLVGTISRIAFSELLFQYIAQKRIEQFISNMENGDKIQCNCSSLNFFMFNK